MTNAVNVDVRNEDVDKKSRKNNPYALPGDGQLLSYLHYKKNTVQRTNSWTALRKNFSRPKPKATAGKKADPKAVLMKELRPGGKGIGATFSRSCYVEDIRQLARLRLMLGQKRDACIHLDQQLDIEQKKFHEIRQRYKECASALERFLGHEHAASMAMLEAAESESRRTSELSERRDSLSRQYGQTCLEVYHWEETWRTVRACHRFVVRVSPLAEREEPTEDVEDLPGSPESASLVAPLSDFGHDSMLSALIAAFEREASALPKSLARTPSDLGLLEAGDLLRIFRAMELQNLNALIHLESLGGPMADMIARIDLAEGHVKREIDDVLEDIKRLEASIVREERRAQRLERCCARLVQQGFRALVCSEEALRARVLVEDAYESCVAPNEAGLEPLAMARGLENAYEHLSAQLDLLPQHLVTACEREGFLRELRESREAEDAAKKFELMHRLLAALRRMMEPLEPKRRPLMYRSLPRGRARRKKSTKISVPGKLLSARDAHLDFFEKVCRATKNDEDHDENDSADDDSANVESA